MKLLSVLLLAAFLQVSAGSRAQLVTLRVKNAPVKTVFKSIRQQTGMNILVADAIQLSEIGKVTLDVKNQDVTTVLRTILDDKQFIFVMEADAIVIKPRPTPIPLFPNLLNADTSIWKSGTVLNEKGDPLSGASVSIKGTKGGTNTDGSGKFRIRAGVNQTIVISFIGYQNLETKVKDASPVIYHLQPANESMKDIVVTGMMTRNKRSFSGATATYSGEQLKTISNTNVVQSLRTLDPSFLIMENNLKGSNPNILPTIELRGQTSISTEGLSDQFSNDPNQPLFILDGFETNLRTIMDLDMNRVASVTILKDAASTALYGSRASNGVVVVETFRPKAGEVRIDYTNDLTVELPDLSSYNRMNAREKLEFERLSGAYIPDSYYEKPTDLYTYYIPLYSKRLQEVERGVNSYWLNEPLQTGISDRHSLYVSGGSGTMLFEAGGSYRKAKGTMIGSGRDEWGARLNLTYRSGRLNVNNVLFVNGAKAEESPYGSFATWVNTNPYYRKLPADQMYLEVVKAKSTTDSIRVANPLYNASLNSFDRTKSIQLTNNLQANYDISNNLRFQANLQLTSGNTDQTVFLSPLHTSFVRLPIERKGTYSNSLMKKFSYTLNAMLTYFKVMNKHSITANLRGEVQDAKNQVLGFTAEGFPAASNGNPRFAFGYTTESTPTSVSAVSRRNSALLSGTYTYDGRYSADLTFRYDGSTAFGANNPYSPYYAVGATWNLDKEEFMRQFPFIDLLRLRGNIGLTGNQNFNSYSSVTTYNYSKTVNHLGQGVLLQSLGNADLEWQNTLQTSVGLDAQLFKNRMSVQLNWYKKVTDPLVVAITLPSSTGLSNYPFNAGSLTVQGAEFNVSYAPVFSQSNGLTWTIGVLGSYYTQVFDNLNDQLHGVNEKMRESNELTRYRDGHSPDDIWAVVSRGIDPATGREIFQKLDGTLTNDYDYRDQVVVGNKRPMVQGTINNSFRYKGFTLNFSFRYLLGQDIFNDALFNNVENISYTSITRNNQDKRALYDRWQKPGDISSFKGISLTSTTYKSSRFVQTENTLTLESVNLGYNFRESAWLSKARLTNLRLNAFTNDVFWISTVKRERGIDYPYARSFSLSLTANFK